MNNLKRICCWFIMFLFLSNMNIKAGNYESFSCKGDTGIKSIHFYAALIHQHQDFFNKAFSFQGIEAGTILNHSILAGVYGALFVSNLNAKVANYQHLFVNIKQGGLFVGKMNNDIKLFHTGWLINLGYFSFTGDDSDFAIFHSQNPKLNIKGLLLTPQVFAELNIARWMKLRTGLSYSFYSFEDQSIIKKTDLNNLSLTFGFIFGKFN